MNTTPYCTTVFKAIKVLAQLEEQLKKKSITIKVSCDGTVENYHLLSSF